MAVDELRVLIAMRQPEYPLFPGQVRWVNLAAEPDGAIVFRVAVSLFEPLVPEGIDDTWACVTFPYDTCSVARQYRISLETVFETMILAVVRKLLTKMPKTRAKMLGDGKTESDLAHVEWTRRRADVGAE
jgi:hypothetical protein